LINSYGESMTGPKKESLFIISQRFLENEKSAAGRLLLATLLPVLLFAFSAIAPMAIASDLVAGEKERSTLDSLLAMPISRMEILVGKYCAIVMMGLIGVVSFMTGIALAYRLSPEIFGADSINLVIAPLSIALIIVCACLLVMIFGVVELIVSIFARSAKEAQILFVPIIMIGMICGYSTVMIDLRHIGAVYRVIPMVSLGVSIKEIAAGIFIWQYLILSSIECIFLNGVLLYVAYKLFLREKTIMRT
jgi:sodium transport system permease protein